MKYEWLDAYLLRKKGVRKDHQKDWNWDRYMIGGKLFAAVCYDDADRAVYITMKLEPAEGDLLRRTFADILPGYYMNHTHWNSVRADGAVEDTLLQRMLDSSYALVLGSFSRKKQAEILEGR